MHLIPLEIDNTFECANADKIEYLSETSFKLSPRPDNAGNIRNVYAKSDYYYAFRILNKNTIPIEATVYIKESGDIPGERTVAVRNVQIGKQLAVKDWIPLPGEYSEVDLKNSTTKISVVVQPEAMLDVTSMYWMSTTQVMDELDCIKSKYRDIRIISLGKTTEGKEILAVDLSPMASPEAPIYMIGATPQCHEFGTIAVMGILEEVLKGKLDDIVKSCRLILIPLTNPEGNSLGTCMTNSLGENIIFGFKETQNAGMPRECKLVWDYIKKINPGFYLEFHSYPHLDRPSFRPYDFDLQLYPDDYSRTKGKVFINAVKAISPNPSVKLEMNSQMEIDFRSSLISRLIRERGIPATLYKLHNRETIEDNVQHAVALVRNVVKAMIPVDGTY